MSSLNLLTEIAVVNRFGESAPTENLFRPFAWIGSQQPYRYNPRKQREFSAGRPSGERVGSGGWLGREDSNLRYTVPKTVALPLGHAPSDAGSSGRSGGSQGGRVLVRCRAALTLPAHRRP